MKKLQKLGRKKVQNSDVSFVARITKWFSGQSETKRYYFCSIIALLISSLFLTWFLEYRYFINDMYRAWSFALTAPLAFFCNALIVFTVLLALWAIINRPLAVVAVVWVLENILGYIHVNKFNTRGYPLLPEDFQLAEQAGSLAKFINIGGLVRLILSCILMIVIVLLFAHFFEKKLHLKNPKEGKTFLRRHQIASRALVC